MELLVLRFLIGWWSVGRWPVHLVGGWLVTGRWLVFIWLVGRLSVVGGRLVLGFKEIRDSSCSSHLEHIKCGKLLFLGIPGFKGRKKMNWFVGKQKICNHKKYFWTFQRIFSLKYQGLNFGIIWYSLTMIGLDIERLSD